MKPREFPESNGDLVKPEGWTEEQCVDLPAHRDGEYVTSCWELSEEDLKMIQETKCVWFRAMGVTHAPIILQVESPFE